MSILKETFYTVLGAGMIFFAERLGKAIIASDLAFWKTMKTTSSYSTKNDLKFLKILLITIGIVLVLSSVSALFRIVLNLGKGLS